MFDNDADSMDLSHEASRSTMGSIAVGLGWLALGVLTLVTAAHAISITMTWANLDPAGGDIITILALIGVGLVEVFAVLTAVLYATHALRAKQKPVAMGIEGLWFLFAAVNLISSFSMKHGQEVPGFVGYWVAFGLPTAGLIVGALFYIVYRLNPDAKRADDDYELSEKFAGAKHRAKIEVLNSPQMKAVIRQMTWQQLPPVIGRQLNLTEAQIAALVRQAPQLLDLNGNGIPDVHEAQPTAVAHQPVPVASPNGHGPGATNH
jgi:dipeptide/tripeptide permease